MTSAAQKDEVGMVLTHQKHGIGVGVDFIQKISVPVTAGMVHPSKDADGIVFKISVRK